MNLKQHLQDLYIVKSKLLFVIDEVETAIRKQDVAVPVQAFEDHWKSMANKNTGIGKLVPYVDYFALSQADGHVEEADSTPWDKAGDASAYGEYRANVRNIGPYYPFATWKQMGRPRG